MGGADVVETGIIGGALASDAPQRGAERGLFVIIIQKQKVARRDIGWFAAGANRAVPVRQYSRHPLKKLTQGFFYNNINVYMLQINRKEGESSASLLYRFTKKIQQSGVLREAKKRRFHHRTPNKLKVRLSALHREVKTKEMKKNNKLGLL